jgi:hypothetical protein
MKTIKILALATIAASVIASSAFAGSYPLTTEQERIKRNAEYWNGKTTGSSGPIVQNPDYIHLAKPEQRMAANNQQYFDKIGYKGGEVTHFNRYTDVSQYPFAGSVLSAERGGYVWSSARK